MLTIMSNALVEVAYPALMILYETIGLPKAPSFYAVYFKLGLFDQIAGALSAQPSIE